MIDPNALQVKGNEHGMCCCTLDGPVDAKHISWDEGRLVWIQVQPLVLRSEANSEVFSTCILCTDQQGATHLVLKRSLIV